MGKSKSTIADTVERFTKELQHRFEGLSFAPDLEPEDGFDAWVYVFVPSLGQPDEAVVRNAARELEDRFWRENGVALMTMIRKKEPVHG